MPAPDQQHSNAANEVAYRAGFISGADTAITGVRNRLAPSDLTKIRAWMRALSQWRIPSDRVRTKAPEFPVLEPAGDRDWRP